MEKGHLSRWPFVHQRSPALTLLGAMRAALLPVRLGRALLLAILAIALLRLLPLALASHVALLATIAVLPVFHLFAPALACLLGHTKQERLSAPAVSRLGLAAPLQRPVVIVRKQVRMM